MWCLGMAVVQKKSGGVWICIDLKFLLYKVEKPSVCLSVRLHFWHADNSVVCALIETGLARNESCVFREHKVYFYKPTEPTVHRQECIKDEGGSSH